MGKGFKDSRTAVARCHSSFVWFAYALCWHVNSSHTHTLHRRSSEGWTQKHYKPVWDCANCCNACTGWFLEMNSTKKKTIRCTNCLHHKIHCMLLALILRDKDQRRKGDTSTEEREEYRCITMETNNESSTQAINAHSHTLHRHFSPDPFNSLFYFFRCSTVPDDLETSKREVRMLKKLLQHFLQTFYQIGTPFQ